MSRLVSRSLSSDDEGDFLNMLQRGVSSSGERKATAQKIESPYKKGFVPKSTPLPSIRKIRRLDSIAKPVNNPLFRPWTSEEGDDDGQSLLESPSRHPNPRRDKLGKNPHNALDNISLLPDFNISNETRPSSSRATNIFSTDFDEAVFDTSDEWTSFRKNPSGVQSNPWPTPFTNRLASSPRKGNRLTIQKRTQASGKSLLNGTSLVDQSSILVNSDATEVVDTSHNISSIKSSGESIIYANDTRSFWSTETSLQEEDATLDKPLPKETAAKFSPPKPRLTLQPLHINRGSLKPTSSLNTKLNTFSNHIMGENSLADASILDTTKNPLRGHQATKVDLANTFAELRLQFCSSSDEEEDQKLIPQSMVPCSPTKINSTSLVSPRKRIRIPSTKELPSVDSFWNQETVDSRNNHFSPTKPLRFSPVKLATKLSPQKNIQKEKRELFDAEKHTIAQDFLFELDTQITGGKIAELAEPTGGVRLLWTKTLNTTAGRANWKRETIRTKHENGTENEVKQNHHASIELAVKVIDNENRLLNVLAHEFCHLANFMINGTTNNPHGKEFKSWAAKCTDAFGSRGVTVTTKHTYDIDFKYIWQCTECAAEYKRHSRSINLQKHKCGSCKSTLKQVKPVPRTGAKGQPSEYQKFVKEHMKSVRQENPGILQKEVMRIVADKWSKRAKAETKTAPDDTLDFMASQMANLALEDQKNV